MPDGVAVPARSTRARLLGVGRAAALVALAAGINGTAVAFAPHYDGTYLSVGTVAVIACLEGSFIGLFAAIAAMLLDHFVAGAPITLAAAAPYAAALVIAAAGRFLLRHPATRTQPMAEGEAAALIGRLQAELTRVRTEADSHRDAATETHNVAVADIDAKQKAWREERQLLERSRGEALEAVDQLRTELQKAQRDTERVRDAERDRLEQLTAASAADRNRLEAELEAVRTEAAAEAQRAGEALDTVSRQLEAVGSQLIATQAELATVRNQHAADIADLDRVRGQVASRTAEIEQLQSAVAVQEKRAATIASQSAARIRELEEQLAQLGPELQAARAATAAAQQQVEAEVQAAREREGRLLAQYEEENAALQRELEASAESVRTLTADLDQARSDASALASVKEAAAREIESLRLMATERSTDASRNADLRKQAEERHAAAQRDMRTLQQQLDDLQRRYDAEMRRVAEATAAVVTRESDVRRDLETRLASAEQRAGELRKQVESLQSDVNAERIRSVEEKNALEAEWSDKLQRIVNNLATDHEADIGDAVAKREEARAEARRSSARLQDAQRIIEEAAAANASLSRDVAALRAALDEERKRAAAERDVFEAKLLDLHDAFDQSTKTVATMNNDLRAARALAEEEQAKREKLDVEWSGKLQSIVTHLASDHEADIGQATVEKEAAKAEARSLNQRVNALQQQIENEREVFRTAQQKWISIRDSLLDKVQKTEDRFRKMIEQQRREHLTERDAIEAELRTLKTSERPLTTDEIAAIRAEPFAPPLAPLPIERTEPMAVFVDEPPAPSPAPKPAEDRRPLVLVVHHNPALRGMMRDTLSGYGYDVVTAADGAEGLRVALARKPDVVVADSAMPKMDGRELCRAIKNSSETPSTKIVLMSAMYTNDVPMKALENDVEPDDILQKPVKPETLKASVSNLISAVGC